MILEASPKPIRTIPDRDRDRTAIMEKNLHGKSPEAEERIEIENTAEANPSIVAAVAKRSVIAQRIRVRVRIYSTIFSRL